MMGSLFATATAAVAIAVLGPPGTPIQSARFADSASSVSTVSSARPAGVRPGGVRPGGGRAVRISPAGVIPDGLHVRLSAAQLGAAASRCASWASQAGFAKNGYVGGSLATAIAVALAESGCRPAACYDDTTGRECTRASTRRSRDNIDRGVWQLNSRAWRNVGNSCAYRALCNARVAYQRVSAYGSYFAPWTTYLTDRFAGYLWAAQRAVNGLARGTITSGLIGSCAAYPADRPGAPAKLANCGSAAADQQWRVAAGTLRTGRGLCLGATSARPRRVTLQRCTGGRLQRWRHRAGDLLFNEGARLCLTDPGSAVKPGRVLADASCGRRQNKAWFRP